MGDQALAGYSAVNFDVEDKDFANAFKETQDARHYVDDYNARHQGTPGFSPLRFTAFFHLNIIDAYPDVVKYPDVVLVGKTVWNPQNIHAEADHYIKLIRDAGRTPGVLLGELKSDRSTRTKTANTADEVAAGFDKVVTPSPVGLGVPVVGFYYNRDDDQTLVAALRRLRPSP
jgi:hypothetical protein